MEFKQEKYFDKEGLKVEEQKKKDNKPLLGKR
jgi:hypothetical protein